MATRYIVHGTDPVSGQATRKLIEAENSAAAEAIASKIGMVVSGSEIDTGPAPSGPARGASVPGAIDQSAEQEEWRGCPSFWNNFWWYASCLLVVGIPFAIYYHLKIKYTRYVLTNQRLRIETGIISREIEEIELYRIQDTAVEQNVIDRALGIGTITIESSDERTPSLRIPKIHRSREVREQIRQLAEARRRWRKVTEIEMQT